MVYGVIVAGGSGTRMGADVPKQFLPLAGKPILIHCLERFVSAGSFHKILVMCPKEWIEYTEELIGEYILKEEDRLPYAEGPISKPARKVNGCLAGIENQQSEQDKGMLAQKDIIVVEAGPERNDTIMNAISFIDTNLEPREKALLVTHDAVRPFVTERIIQENVSMVESGATCITAVPATDTIAKSPDGCSVSEIPDRSQYYQIQTPQSFGAGRFKELYLAMSEEDKKKLTDAGKVFLAGGDEVKIVRGENYNIKITYPWDIDMAEALAAIANSSTVVKG